MHTKINKSTSSGFRSIIGSLSEFMREGGSRKELGLELEEDVRKPGVDDCPSALR